MSIIQSIREKAAPVVIGVIALSLIGFILMDAGKGGAGGGVSPSDAIGKVNGVNISYESFLDKAKMNEQMYEMNGRVVDENTRQQIYADTWRTMIESSLLDQELGKLGLTVTDKEFNDMLFGANPPEFLKQEFTDQNTGQFDVAAAKQAISQLKKQQNSPNKDMIDKFYLNPLLENGVRRKYMNLLQNSVYVPTWMAEKAIADNALVSNFSFVQVPYASVPDSSVKVTDEQIMEYVKSHRKEFKQEETSRSIAYVAFPFNPSSDDSASVLREVSSLKEEFKSATDPGAFVTRNGSGIPFYDGYYSASRIQIPAKDSILNAGVGNVYGPYMDGNAYVLSRIVDIKNLPDSAKVRHILIGVANQQNPQGRDDSTASKLADSLLTAIKGGSDFGVLAAMYSDDPGSKNNGGVYEYFPQGQMVKEFNDFSFEKPRGEKGVVRTQFGYHVIEVMDQKNFGPSYKIAYLAKNIDASQATINDALNKATMFAGASRSVKAFNENVTKDGYSKLVAQDIKENDYSVIGLGNNRGLVKDIFKADVGDVLEPEEIDNQFVVVTVTGEEKEGLPSVAKARPQAESIVRNQLKAKQLIAKIGTPASLDAVAQSTGQTVQHADSVSFLSPMIPGGGYDLKVGGFAFNKDAVNKVSKPIEGASGVYVLKVEGIGAKAESQANAADMQRNLANQLKGSAFYNSLQALRDAADVVDKRSKFL